MPQRPCTTPGCKGRVPIGERGSRCARCQIQRRRDSDRARGNAAQRGYDHQWRKGGAEYFAAHPYCVVNGPNCTKIAKVRDHYPKSRRQLVAEGVADPDAWRYLRPVCRPCHSWETTRHQPGGWNAR